MTKWISEQITEYFVTRVHYFQSQLYAQCTYICTMYQAIFSGLLELGYVLSVREGVACAIAPHPRFLPE